jgi:hypothetical protein
MKINPAARKNDVTKVPSYLKVEDPKWVSEFWGSVWNKYTMYYRRPGFIDDEKQVIELDAFDISDPLGEDVRGARGTIIPRILPIKQMRLVEMLWGVPVTINSWRVQILDPDQWEIKSVGNTPPPVVDLFVNLLSPIVPSGLKETMNAERNALLTRLSSSNPEIESQMDTLSIPHDVITRSLDRSSIRGKGRARGSVERPFLGRRLAFTDNELSEFEVDEDISRRPSRAGETSMFIEALPDSESDASSVLDLRDRLLDDSFDSGYEITETSIYIHDTLPNQMLSTPRRIHLRPIQVDESMDIIEGHEEIDRQIQVNNLQDELREHYHTLIDEDWYTSEIIPTDEALSKVQTESRQISNIRLSNAHQMSVENELNQMRHDYEILQETARRNVSDLQRLDYTKAEQEELLLQQVMEIHGLTDLVNNIRLELNQTIEESKQKVSEMAADYRDESQRVLHKTNMTRITDMARDIVHDNTAKAIVRQKHADQLRTVTIEKQIVIDELDRIKDDMGGQIDVIQAQNDRLVTERIRGDIQIETLKAKQRELSHQRSRQEENDTSAIKLLGDQIDDLEQQIIFISREAGKPKASFPRQRNFLNQIRNDPSGTRSSIILSQDIHDIETFILGYMAQLKKGEIPVNFSSDLLDAEDILSSSNPAISAINIEFKNAKRKMINDQTYDLSKLETEIMTNVEAFVKAGQEIDVNSDEYEGYKILVSIFESYVGRQLNNLSAQLGQYDTYWHTLQAPLSTEHITRWGKLHRDTLDRISIIHNASSAYLNLGPQVGERTKNRTDFSLLDSINRYAEEINNIENGIAHNKEAITDLRKRTDKSDREQVVNFNRDHAILSTDQKNLKKLLAKYLKINDKLAEQHQASADNDFNRDPRNEDEKHPQETDEKENTFINDMLNASVQKLDGFRKILEERGNFVPDFNKTSSFSLDWRKIQAEISTISPSDTVDNISSSNIQESHDVRTASASDRMLLPDLMDPDIFADNVINIILSNYESRQELIELSRTEPPEETDEFLFDVNTRLRQNDLYNKGQKFTRQMVENELFQTIVQGKLDEQHARMEHDYTIHNGQVHTDIIALHETHERRNVIDLNRQYNVAVRADAIRDILDKLYLPRSHENIIKIQSILEYHRARATVSDITKFNFAAQGELTPFDILNGELSIAGTPSAMIDVLDSYIDDQKDNHKARSFLKLLQELESTLHNNFFNDTLETLDLIRHRQPAFSLNFDKLETGMRVRLGHLIDLYPVDYAILEHGYENKSQFWTDMRNNGPSVIGEYIGEHVYKELLYDDIYDDEPQKQIENRLHHLETFLARAREKGNPENTYIESGRFLGFSKYSLTQLNVLNDILLGYIEQRRFPKLINLLHTFKDESNIKDYIDEPLKAIRNLTSEPQDNIVIDEREFKQADVDEISGGGTLETSQAHRILFDFEARIDPQADDPVTINNSDSIKNIVKLLKNKRIRKVDHEQIFDWYVLLGDLSKREKFLNSITPDKNDSVLKILQKTFALGQFLSVIFLDKDLKSSNRLISQIKLIIKVFPRIHKTNDYTDIRDIILEYLSDLNLNIASQTLQRFAALGITRK